MNFLMLTINHRNFVCRNYGIAETVILNNSKGMDARKATKYFEKELLELSTSWLKFNEDTSPSSSSYYSSLLNAHMARTDFDEKRFCELTAKYHENLKSIEIKEPNSFYLGVSETFNRMVWAIIKGSYNKESDALKKACRELKIKHTYKAINAYLRGED